MSVIEAPKLVSIKQKRKKEKSCRGWTDHFSTRCIYHIRSKRYLIGTSEFMYIVQILIHFFMPNLNTLSDLEFKQILRCY